MARNDWNNLAYNVNTIGDSYSDQYFKMADDITVSEKVGTGYGDGTHAGFIGVMEIMSPSVSRLASR